MEEVTESPAPAAATQAYTLAKIRQKADAEYDMADFRDSPGTQVYLQHLDHDRGNPVKAYAEVAAWREMRIRGTQ